MRILSCNRRRLAALLILVASDAPALGQIATQPAGPTLFQNVRVFDGKSDRLGGATSVLIEGGKIAKIAPSISAPERALVIAGNGRVLMPGLIDVHWHAMLVRPTPAALLFERRWLLQPAWRAQRPHPTLMRGFTTIRDMGGPAFGLKRAIDEGVLHRPRIYPSGAVITITSGHGDFRQLSDLPRTIGGMLSRIEQLGGSMIADSPDEVRLRAREQLMQGASQIKLTAGGGVASPFSPLDVSTFTEAELHAAVEAAENWGTYVCHPCIHAHGHPAIDRGRGQGASNTGI